MSIKQQVLPAAESAAQWFQFTKKSRPTPCPSMKCCAGIHHSTKPCLRTYSWGCGRSVEAAAPVAKATRCSSIHQADNQTVPAAGTSSGLTHTETAQIHCKTAATCYYWWLTSPEAWPCQNPDQRGTHFSCIIPAPAKPATKRNGTAQQQSPLLLPVSTVRV